MNNSTAMLAYLAKHGWVLLAESNYRVWGRFDRQHASFGRTEIILIAGATVLVIGTWLISNELKRRRTATFTTSSSAKLFRELCRAHRLPMADHRLLKKLAAARGIENTAELIIKPEHFEAAELPPVLKSSAHELQKIRRRLFE